MQEKSVPRLLILEALHNNLSKATNPNCWNIYLISNYHTEEPYQNFPSQLFQKLVSCKKVPKMSFRVENVWQLPNETFEEIQTVCGKMYSYAKKIHAHFELDHPDSGSVVPCLKCWQYFFFWIGFHFMQGWKVTINHGDTRKRRRRRWKGYRKRVQRKKESIDFRLKTVYIKGQRKVFRRQRIPESSLGGKKLLT